MQAIKQKLLQTIDTAVAELSTSNTAVASLSATPLSETDSARVDVIYNTLTHVLTLLNSARLKATALGHEPKPRYFNITNGELHEVSAEDYIDPEADGVKIEEGTPPIPAFTPADDAGRLI